ncbi:MAG: 4Fe-4S binding protein [Candidatus Korobacteraceae bacterium]|jgi:NAD-dependent dihydropyrimidine dehydrogenase PreA subunit
MPYVINKQCSEEDIAPAVNACPYGCIYPNKNAFLGQPAYVIDPELCTDCGACALACPSGAFAPAVEFGRYGEVPTYRIGAARDTHISVGPIAAPAETPAFEVIMNELSDTFVASHVYTKAASRNSRTGVTPPPAADEMPASEVIMKEWIDTFVASHV